MVELLEINENKEDPEQKALRLKQRKRERLMEPLKSYTFKVTKPDGNIRIYTEKDKPTTKIVKLAFDQGHLQAGDVLTQLLLTVGGNAEMQNDLQQEINQRLENEIKLDSLTLLYNKKTLIPKLEGLLEVCRTSKNVALLVLSIDMRGLKAENNINGQVAGDRKLIRFAGDLKVAIRDNDFLFRTGGDEFRAFILVEPKDTSASSLEESIRNTIQRVTGSLQENAYIGYSILSNKSDQDKTSNENEFSVSATPDELIDASDRMMLHNKYEEKGKKWLSELEGTYPDLAQAKFFLDKEADSLSPIYIINLKNGESFRVELSIKVDNHPAEFKEGVANYFKNKE